MGPVPGNEIGDKLSATLRTAPLTRSRMTARKIGDVSHYENRPYYVHHRRLQQIGMFEFFFFW
jgi:hypothetical protein